MVGLFVAVVGYPVLHEVGHVMAAVLVGADVVEFSVWPLPSVLCDMERVGNHGFAAIGFGGTLFPILISLLLPQGRFFVWYFRALLQGVSLLALGVSFVSVLFKINPQDDIFQVLQFGEYNEAFLLLLIGCGMVGVWHLIVAGRPVHRVRVFFGI